MKHVHQLADLSRRESFFLRWGPLFIKAGFIRSVYPNGALYVSKLGKIIDSAGRPKLLAIFVSALRAWVRFNEIGWTQSVTDRRYCISRSHYQYRHRETTPVPAVSQLEPFRLKSPSALRLRIDFLYNPHNDTIHLEPSFNRTKRGQRSSCCREDG